MNRYPAIVAALAAALIPAIATAQSPAGPAGLVAGTLSSGDTAWVLACAVLALMAALPGLAMVHAGLLRAGHGLSAALQVAAVLATTSLIWIVAGHTLAFGDPHNGWIGDGNLWMLLGAEDLLHGDADISERSFALLQLSFAALAAALLTGAWAERARFGWAIGCATLWSLIVYAPIAHWIWGGGWLATTMGTLDFAGGLVVHTSAGCSALVAALLVGKRHAFSRTPPLPQAPAVALAGTGLLWLGWLALAGGSALAASDAAAGAMLALHLGTSAAGLTWLLLEHWRCGKASASGFASGAMAGLATLAPVAGYSSTGAALLLGPIGAALGYAAVRLVRPRLGIDDRLDLFALSGVGGMSGALLLAVVLHPALGGPGYAEGAGLASQLAAQAIGLFAVALWSVLGTVLIALLVALVVPMRVSEDTERDGLDRTSHGEPAWRGE